MSDLTVEGWRIGLPWGCLILRIWIVTLSFTFSVASLMLIKQFHLTVKTISTGVEEFSYI